MSSAGHYGAFEHDTLPRPPKEFTFVRAGEALLGKQINKAVRLHIPHSMLRDRAGRARLIEWMLGSLFTRIPPGV